MSVTTSYPGIYINEDRTPNFSITSDVAAVPAFLTSRSESGAPQEKICYFQSWGDVKKVVPKEYWHTKYYNTLFLWFSHGGGGCYLIDYPEVKKITAMDDVTLVVAHGRNNALIPYISDLCYPGKNRFILLDGPMDKITSSTVPSEVTDGYPVSPYAAVWYPWIKTERSTTAIPPSVAAAISLAKTDRIRGVWKTPANEVIHGITPLYPVSDELQGGFTQGKALNMIRTFPELGTVAWGARTLEDSDNWRYIPVRRLFSMVEWDIQQMLNKFVFEPNSQPTWQQGKTAVDNYFYRLWRQGALLGNKEEEAWFVRIGKGITMTDDDINQGKMIINVGLAAVQWHSVKLLPGHQKSSIGFWDA